MTSTQWPSITPLPPPPPKPKKNLVVVVVIAISVALVIGLCLVIVSNSHSVQPTAAGDGMVVGEQTQDQGVPTSVSPTTAPAPANETSEERLIRIFDIYWVDTRPGNLRSEPGHGEYLVLESPYTNLDSFLSDLGASPSVYTNMTTTWNGRAFPPGYIIEWNTYTTNTIGVNQIQATIIADPRNR